MRAGLDPGAARDRARPRGCEPHRREPRPRAAGSGYLGRTLVDYGLGNFASYNDSFPTDVSGTLAVAATGRHIDAYSWRPALIEGDLPVPVTSAVAHEVQARFVGARACTDLTGRPGAPLATVNSETHGVPSSLLAQLSGWVNGSALRQRGRRRCRRTRRPRRRSPAARSPLAPQH